MKMRYSIEPNIIMGYQKNSKLVRRRIKPTI